MARTSKRSRRTSPLNLPGAFELFKPSREIVLKNIWVFGPIYGALMFIGLIDWSLTPADASNLWFTKQPDLSYNLSDPGAPIMSAANFFTGVPVVWTILAIILGFILQIIAQRAQLDGSEHKTIGFGKLWRTVTEMGVRLAGLYIIIGILSLIGFILLIIPGFIVLRRYSMAPYIMMEKNTGIKESMRVSADMTKPYSGSVYSIIGVTILIAFTFYIPVIGWLVSFILGMLYSIAFALRYQQLKKLASR